jgi:phosphinothricin acetyltransferase
MTGGLRVRRAALEDAEACASIYAPYVRDTAISFEAEPPTVEEMARRIAAAQERHDWLVLVDEEGTVLGYCYAGSWRTRAAYRHTCELGIYVAPAAQGLGGGRLLYETIFDRLAALGFRTLVAGMTQSETQPNPGSRALHLALGFEPAGVMRRVGWKHGHWHDVAFFQRPVGTSDPEAPPGSTV